MAANSLAISILALRELRKRSEPRQRHKVIASAPALPQKILDLTFDCNRRSLRAVRGLDTQATRVFDTIE
jgi:hypothetical protein